MLEDTNADGAMDRRTVFADGLVLARSLKVLDHGVLVAEPPNVWLMRDSDGDLRMDTKDLVTDQFGRRETDPENNANAFYWALDNWMHTSGQTTIQLRLKHGAFEVQKTLQRGEWGVAQDDAGRIFRNTNESALHVDYVPTAYFARNPNLLRTRGSYERLADDDNGLNTVWPVRAESRHQPRVSGRHRSSRRIAGEVHLGLRAGGLPGRPAAGGSRTATCSSPSRPPTW